MTRLPDKTITTNDLDLHWDKNVQSYIEQQKNYITEQNIVRNVEEYLDFLADIEPAFSVPKTIQLVNKQFSL